MLQNLRILTKNKDPIVLTLTISFKNSFLTQTRRNAYLRYNPTPVRCGKKLSRNKNHKILSKNYRINGTIEIGINKLVKNYRIKRKNHVYTWNDNSSKLWHFSSLNFCVSLHTISIKFWWPNLHMSVIPLSKIHYKHSMLCLILHRVNQALHPGLNPNFTWRYAK